jgi:hypothetical protein
MTADQAGAIVRLMEAMTDHWRAIHDELYILDYDRPKDFGLAFADGDSALAQAARRVHETWRRCDEATSCALDTGLTARLVAHITGISIERVEELRR